MSNAVVIEETERNLIIRFARPEIRNPLSIDVLGELSCILEGAAKRDDLARVVFTGTDDVFASGANLREIAEVGSGEAREFALRGQRLMTRISELPMKSFAAVNGFCFGGALDLALACKIRISSREAIFAHPGAELGIITGWGGTQRLPRLVGEAVALEMFFTARRVTAQEALRVGLVDGVVERPLEHVLDF